MDPTNQDTQFRQAAFDHVNRLATFRGGVLASSNLAGGFEFDGERIPLINPQRGIFKSRQMAHLLSIKTVFPRRGARVWYDDQREAHRQIYAGDDVVEYAFMGTDPNSAVNRWLLDAMREQTPIIYFLGTSPGRLNRRIGELCSVAEERQMNVQRGGEAGRPVETGLPTRDAHFRPYIGRPAPESAVEAVSEHQPDHDIAGASTRANSRPFATGTTARATEQK